MVQHAISDPEPFWSVDPTTLSRGITLHHSFATPDGTRAVCIWEADPVDAVRNTLEPVAGRISRNEYFTVENREGLARPSRVSPGPPVRRRGSSERVARAQGSG